MTQKHVAMMSILMSASMILGAHAQEEGAVETPQGIKVDLPCIVYHIHLTF